MFLELSEHAERVEYDSVATVKLVPLLVVGVFLHLSIFYPIESASLNSVEEAFGLLPKQASLNLGHRFVHQLNVAHFNEFVSLALELFVGLVDHSHD